MAILAAGGNGENQIPERELLRFFHWLIHISFHCGFRATHRHPCETRGRNPKTVVKNDSCVHYSDAWRTAAYRRSLAQRSERRAR